VDKRRSLPFSPLGGVILRVTDHHPCGLIIAQVDDDVGIDEFRE